MFVGCRDQKKEVLILLNEKAQQNIHKLAHNLIRQLYTPKTIVKLVHEFEENVTIYPNIVDSKNRIVKFYVSHFTDEFPNTFEKIKTERVYSTKSNFVANLTSYFSNFISKRALIFLLDDNTFGRGSFIDLFPDHFKQQEDVDLYRVSHGTNIKNKVVTTQNSPFTDIMYRDITYVTKLLSSLLPTVCEGMNV